MTVELNQLFTFHTSSQWKTIPYGTPGIYFLNKYHISLTIELLICLLDLLDLSCTTIKPYKFQVRSSKSAIFYESLVDTFILLDFIVLNAGVTFLYALF